MQAGPGGPSAIPVTQETKPERSQDQNPTRLQSEFEASLGNLARPGLKQ